MPDMLECRGPASWPQHHACIPASTPGCRPAMQPPPRPPPLCRAVRDLAWEVFGPGLGPSGVQAVAGFLAEQCVGSLADLEFLELDWMVAALAPRGVPPMLLNKFLALGRRRAGPGAVGEDATGARPRPEGLLPASD